jgi:hypothetical protein
MALKRAIWNWLEIDYALGELERLRRESQFRDGQIDALCVIIAEVLGDQSLPKAKQAAKMLEDMKDHLASRYDPSGVPTGSPKEAGAENVRSLISGVLDSCIEYQKRKRAPIDASRISARRCRSTYL